MANDELTVNRLQQCVAKIHRWCSSRRLQMKAKKTEFISFGSRTNFQNLAASISKSSLTVTCDVIQCANTVCDLEITVDSELSMQSQISKVARTCF